jgi:hypothetical protein
MAEETFEQTVTDKSTYPIQVQVVGPAIADGDRPAASGGRTVEATIRDVLGWRVRDDDPRGFLAALNRAFSFVEVEGHREWQYTPQSLTVQADMGAVTGAQASIYTRTKLTVDQILPIVDRLRALDPAADHERLEASRSIVRGRLEQLPFELGLDGGPRVARVDDIFRILLDVDPSQPVPADASIGGELGRLKARFGFDGDNVNTVEEEEILTEFQVLTDYVLSLATSWARIRKTFDRNERKGDRFLGTQLVRLSRTLAIVAETVEEVRAALRSVFIGDAEMELIDITKGVRPPLSLAEGLRWIEDLATVEGPKLVGEAGKEGVDALAPTLRRLSKFASGAARQKNVGGRSPRVRGAFTDLAANLRLARSATGGMRPDRPTIKRVDTVLSGNRLQSVTIVGTDLGPPAVVLLRAGRATITADTVDGRDDETELTASFSPPVDVSAGPVTVVVEVDDEVVEKKVDVGSVDDGVPRTQEAQE